MQTTGPSEGRVLKELRHGLGLDLARQGLLERGVGLSIDTGARRDDSTQSALSSGKAAAVVKVERSKAGQIRLHKSRSRKTGNVGGKRVLSSISGAKPPRRDAEGWQAPVVIRKRTTDEATQGRSDMGICGKEASGLHVRRHRAARVENLGPPRTGAEEAESSLRVWEATNSLNECPCRNGPGVAHTRLG